ncbi:MAG: DUF3795 domain-containing protein [Caldiserica bacterium]|nr:DUF3795 domain-containing protein [Caldisericota bacterium]MDH7563218.1 DUF3795 domain-containing protein [Caldisericota bacterium]
MKEVACCTLYCGLCASRRRIPHEAKKLREMLKKEGYDQGYFDVPELHPIFENFWEGLNLLADVPCRGCQDGGGYPSCPVRKCVKEKQLFSCAECSQFPCQMLKDFLKNYPLFNGDSKRLKEIGYEKWVKEQEKRATAGFSYADVRPPRMEE